jgi:hypothetical protein
MTRILMVPLAACLLAAWPLGAVAPAAAEVHVQRTSDENPMKEVAKSVFYGGLAGLMIGSAIAIADDGGDDGDKVRWGFAAGTFLGLGFGLYHVMSRPSGAALIEIEDGQARLAFAQPTIGARAGVRLALVRARF